MTRDASVSQLAPLRLKLRVDRRRLESSVGELSDFVARILRNLGVDETHVEGAVQKVFLLALRQEQRFDAVLDRASLFRAATRIAEQARRRWPRRPGAGGSARARLDDVLDSLNEEVREVFVLCEIEHCDVAWAAAALGHNPRWAMARLRHGQRVFCTKLGVHLDRKRHSRLSDAALGEAGEVLASARTISASPSTRARTLRAINAVGSASLLGKGHLLFSRLSLAVVLALGAVLCAGIYFALRALR